MKGMAFTVLLASVALATPSAAQVAWDAPMLLAPGSPGGLGILLVEPPGSGLSGGSNAGVGVLGMWRRSPVPVGIGVRIGLAEDAFDDVAVLAGLDVSGTLFTPTEELPVGFIWLLGAGISVGDEVLLSFPVGISAGGDLETDGVLFRPYATPRVSLDVWSGEGDHVDLAVALDLGLDVGFDPGWLIRFAASFGDRQAIAVGLAFPGVSF